jgi:ribosomal subunit interface protein
MKINIESPHLVLSQNLKHKIEYKFSHLQKLYDRITSCDITVFKQKDDEQKNYFIEAKLLLPQDALFVKENAEHFDKALYQSVKNLLRQVREYKEQLKEIR